MSSQQIPVKSTIELSQDLDKDKNEANQTNKRHSADIVNKEAKDRSSRNKIQEQAQGSFSSEKDDISNTKTGASRGSLKNEGGVKEDIDDVKQHQPRKSGRQEIVQQLEKDKISSKKEMIRRKSQALQDGQELLPAVASIAQLNENNRQGSQSIKKTLEKWLDHYSVVILMTLVTAYSLYFDDFRVLALPKSVDDTFFIVTFVCMMMFTIEIVLRSYALDEYVYSFFFWLDIISTVTMITDIPWLWDPILGQGSDEGGGNQAGKNSAQLAQTTRASKITKVIRVIRLIRLIRIVKLYKQQQLIVQKASKEKRSNEVKTNVRKSIQGAGDLNQKIHPSNKGESQAAAENSSEENSDVNMDDVSDGDLTDDAGEFQVPEESKISKTLSDKTTRTVIILVLVLLFLLALCNIDTYSDVDYIHHAGVIHLKTIYDLGESAYPQYKIAYETFIEQVGLDTEFPLVFVHIADPTKDKWPGVYLDDKSLWGEDVMFGTVTLKDLRQGEFTTVSSNAPDTDNGITFSASYSNISQTKAEAITNLSKTTFICFVLAIAAHYFTKDASDLVLEPLERMIEKVTMIAKNPLSAATDKIDSAGVMSFAQTGDQKILSKEDKAQQAQYETVVLEKAIVKIGHLLALGFGEAGAGIIGQNMTNGGELNPMLPGQKTYCIFGFCILNNFIDTTEVLQEEIMHYVNSVAEITHSMVDRYGGSANKNIGDAFLLVWKFADPDEIEKMDNRGHYESSEVGLENQVLCDMSVFSFLKIIAKLNKFKHITTYNSNKELTKRVPGFKVKMGFGLHQGWAIEGAIGSFFKIDASYLSPNVNMAARLEAATGQFQTLILISGLMRDLLSKQFQGICREIDTVTVKGSIKPMRLYTITIQTEDLEQIDDPMIDKPIKIKKAQRDQLREELFSRLNSGKTTTWHEINTDSDFLELRKTVDPKFEALFVKCYQAYLKGDWESAGRDAAELVIMRPDDGPSISLNKTINIRHERKAPKKWVGVRELTSK